MRSAADDRTQPLTDNEPENAESLEEQTIVFQAIRPDEDNPVDSGTAPMASAGSAATEAPRPGPADTTPIWGKSPEDVWGPVRSRPDATTGQDNVRRHAPADPEPDVGDDPAAAPEGPPRAPAAADAAPRSGPADLLDPSHDDERPGNPTDRLVSHPPNTTTEPPPKTEAHTAKRPAPRPSRTEHGQAGRREAARGEAQRRDPRRGDAEGRESERGDAERRESERGDAEGSDARLREDDVSGSPSHGPGNADAPHDESSPAPAAAPKVDAPAAEAPDDGTADAEVSEAEVSEAEVSEAEVSEAEVPDAGAPDADSSDIHFSDAGSSPRETAGTGGAVAGEAPADGDSEPASAEAAPSPVPAAGPSPGSRGNPALVAAAIAADGAASAVPEQGGEEASAKARVVEVALPDAAVEALTSALAALRDSVINLRFGLDLPGAEEAKKARAEIIAQLGDYVIPRVRMSTAPALVVVAGSTGAGKSTLVNTLAGQKVSATGVRRPTTATPVLACHPDDYEWYSGSGLLPDLERVTDPAAEATGEAGGLVVAQTERLPQGVALLDTPDIDSVVEEHHEIAHRMLDAADLWIFVTTAARYADAPAWRLLRLAKERGARLAIVLSRVPPKSREVVLKHFVRMLTEYGLGEVDRFVVDEGAVSGGLLKEGQVAELRLWLAELSVDEQRRAEAVQETLNGVLNSFRARIPALARHVEAQVAFRTEARGDVDAAYMAALAEIDESTRNGTLLSGEALARWQDFAGSGDLKRTLRLRKAGRFGGKSDGQAPERIHALKSALKSGLDSVIVSAAQRAAEEVVARWLHRGGAGAILASTPGLDAPSEDFVRRAGRTVAAWQDHVVGLIRTEGVTKRSVARVISYDLESLALIFMVGLLGYGTSEAGGEHTSTALPQRLLRAVLGAESLRNIGAKARSDLRARISMLFDEETLRHVEALDASGIPDENAATRLYQATYQLEAAR
ncbi:Dynamin family protein [Sinosporangium album]|uniref:Dynamin family protein n=1 Tax=Sinosporangium album TaxID=504805 RepID=A0A1G7T655_9ACTN|nr:dynamin family protein [Sinosporangium album]SDG30711.1 Dynamin family protein [Sinosporangium album]